MNEQRCVEVCGGVWRCVEVCGGVWRCVEVCGEPNLQQPRLRVQMTLVEPAMVSVLEAAGQEFTALNT